MDDLDKPVKATLKIILKANDTTVAEIEDPALWQSVLLAIHNGTTVATTLNPREQAAFTEPAPPVSSTAGSGPVEKLARTLGVTADELEGACGPTADKPFLSLNVNSWEQMKAQTPSRGSSSMNPTGTVATLLCLWFREAALGNVTHAHVREALHVLRVEDKNPTRGLKNTPWLLYRGGVISINPAQNSKAIAIGRSFCTSNWKTK